MNCRVGVMVLGVGRSGTSLAAAVIAALAHGSELPVDDFPATVDNPRGYRESMVLTDLNQRVLEALGGSWNVPPVLSAGWTRRVSARPEFTPDRSRAAFDSVFSTPGWIWKDPRNTMLAPYWFEVLSTVDGIALIYRDPIEMARSTSRQFPGMSIAHGLALWERCVRSAVANSLGRSVLVMCHRDLIRDRDRWIGDAVDFVSHTGFQPAHSSVVNQVIEPSLHRQRNEGDVGSNPGAPACQRLIRVLDELRGFHETFPQVDLGTESAEVEELFASLRS